MRLFRPTRWTSAIDSSRAMRSWMAKTHHREGTSALFGYGFSKGPELAIPLDPGSTATRSRPVQAVV